MADQEVTNDLIDFIKEARSRGYTDEEIKDLLIEKKWPEEETALAFTQASIQTEYKNPSIQPIQPNNKVNNQNIIKPITTANKTTLTITLDEPIMKALIKRSKKNILSVQAQVEDIVRRSCVNSRSSSSSLPEKLDDIFIGIFSRKKSNNK